MTTKEKIIATVTGFSVKDVFDVSTHKLYPFHYFNSFNSRNYHPELNPDSQHIDCVCDGCGEEFTGNHGGYFSACIVFHGPDNVGLACCRNCIPANSLEYHSQIYGFRDPIFFPEKLSASLLHEVAFNFMRGSDWYKLRAYKAISLEQFKSDFRDRAEAIGGVGSTDLRYDYSNLKFRIEAKDGMKKFTPSQFIAALNDILKENTAASSVKQPEPGFQFSLFDV